MSDYFYFRQVQTILDYFWLVQTISEYFSLFQIISDYFRLLQTIYYLRLFQTIFQIFILFQSISNYFWLFQNFLWLFYEILWDILDFFFENIKFTLEAEVLSSFCSCCKLRGPAAFSAVDFPQKQISFAKYKLISFCCNYLVMFVTWWKIYHEKMALIQSK